MDLSSIKKFFGQCTTLPSSAGSPHDRADTSDDMDKLISRFSHDIAQNRLRMVVCKSYLKYSNLCSAKVMAGGIAVISADDQAARNAKSYLEQVETDMNRLGHNDAQLMTHFLKNREHEFNLLERSVENAHFVANQIFTGKDGHTHFDRADKHLPSGTTNRHRRYPDQNQSGGKCQLTLNSVEAAD